MVRLLVKRNSTSFCKQSLLASCLAQMVFPTECTKFFRLLSLFSSIYLIDRVFVEKKIPTCWGWAFIVLLVKEPDKNSDPGDLRPIACTDTAGKLFWSLMNDRLRLFWTRNQYITPQQKGALSDVSG